MFTPSSHDVRRFFCEAWRKQRAGEVLTPMDAIAADWIVQHPEYHEALMDADEAVACRLVDRLAIVRDDDDLCRRRA